MLPVYLHVSGALINISFVIFFFISRSYFSEDGLEYNIIRLPIGSTDFSTRFYAYNQYPKDDTALSNFTFAPEDIKYKVGHYFSGLLSPFSHTQYIIYMY